MYLKLRKFLTNCTRFNMPQNESGTLDSLTMYPYINTSTPSANIGKLFDHWAWDFYVYTFATLFGIFALGCFVIIIRQCTQPGRSRNIHGRFTTVQLFVAATLKVFALFWSPVLLKEASQEIFTATLLIDCFSMALILSAFSILLLILLETTKTSLAPPRLQSIWVLLSITAVLTAVMLTFNLLVLYADREFWYFVSYLSLFTWGTLICVGYVIAGYRMWRNLKSSRQVGKSTGERRLKNITMLVFLAPCITAASLILNVCLAASDFGIFAHLNVTERTIWSRYAIMFLLRSCEFAIVVLIFGIVIRTKSGKSSVDDAPTVQLGTFAAENTPARKENCEDAAEDGNTEQ